MLLWCSGCTWRKGRHGDKDVDRGRIKIVDDAKGLLPIHIPLMYCCLCFTIAIAIVGSRSGCSCCCVVPVALGGKDVMVTKMLIEDVLALLMLLKDC